MALRTILTAGTVAAAILLVPQPTPAAIEYFRENYQIVGEAGTVQTNQTANTRPNNPLEAAADESTDSLLQRGRTTMDVNTGETGIRFGGTLDVEVQPRVSPPPVVGSGSQTYADASIVFQLDGPHTYRFTSDVDRSVLTGEVDVGTAFSFSRGNGDPEDEDFIFVAEPNEEDATRTGTLEAGTYSFGYLTRGFTVTTGASGGPFGTYQATYDVSLILTPVTDGGGTPNPIPLPAGVWGGLALLAVIPRLRRWVGGKLAPNQ